MPVYEKSAQEILLEQLAQQVAKLSAESKSYAAIIKEQKEQIKLLEAEYAQKKGNCEREYAVLEAALRAQVAPLEDKKMELQSLMAQVEKSKREAIEAAASVRTAKSMEIQKADEVVNKLLVRQARIEKTIDDCKAKVATL